MKEARKRKQTKSLETLKVNYCYDIISEAPPNTKRPKTSHVVVEQTGDSDKVVIDHVTDSDSIFEDVKTYHIPK